MSLRVPLRRAALLLALFALPAGCSDDPPNAPPVTPRPPATPTLANLWPVADGNLWRFGLARRSWADPFYGWMDPDSVPPAPSVAEAVTMSAGWGAPIPIGTDTTTYTMRFRFGAADTLLSDSVAVPLLLNAIGAPVRRFVPAGGQGFGVDLAPVFLQAGAWSSVLTDDGAAAAGLSTPPWIYLKAPLVTGTAFTQDAPGFAVRHARITGTVTATTAFGTFANAIECAFVMDYGVQEVQTSGGTRYLRPWDFGRLVWVPELGPVSLYERLDLEAGDTTGRSSGERRLRLIDRSVAAPAVTAGAASGSR